MDSTALISTVCVLLITSLFFSIQQNVGLPPTVVLIRIIRPYATIVLILSWLTYRQFFDDKTTTNDDNNPTSALTILYHHIYPHLTRHLNSHTILLLEDLIAYILLHTLLLAPLLTIQKTYNASQTNLLATFRAYVTSHVFQFAKTYIPPVKNRLEKEKRNMRRTLSTSLKPSSSSNETTKYTTLPPHGLSHATLLSLHNSHSTIENRTWRSGRVSGTVYHSGDDSHTSLLDETYKCYSWSNPLHADIWKSVAQMESEVCAMTAGLMSSSKRKKSSGVVVGSLTSGGTESIILAVRASLEYFGTRRGISRGEIIAATTAHAALDKACDMFGLRLIKIPIIGHDDNNTSWRLEAKEVLKRVTPDTILIYASAPNFPHGVIDDVEGLSEVAVRYGVGLHVDACLGGFVLPFAREILGGKGGVVPRFDFDLEGVTSMSCDTHKYGYASKGTSVVLYRNEELRRCQYFSYAQWPGGLYFTPTIAGSRPGALIACAWTSLLSIGHDGFISRTQSILSTTRTLSEKIDALPYMRVLAPELFKSVIVAFDVVNNDKDDVTLNIYEIGDEMKKLGWNLNALQHPPCLHLCVTLLTVGKEEEFVKDLEGVVGFMKNTKKKKNGKKANDGSAAIYGMAGSMPAGPVEELLKCYVDVILTP